MSKFNYSKEKFMGRKQLFNSNKMQPLLNASKAWETNPPGALKKREPSTKYTKYTNLVLKDL